MNKIKNQAFIDAQNLHLGTTMVEPKWRVDLVRFRVYLREKYKAEKAYYFIGAYEKRYRELYRSTVDAGFELVFREYDPKQAGKKKGNVDTDIVFSMMEKIAERERLDKMILVSGDGDYFRTVKYLIRKNKLEKVLAPSKNSFSSLYKRNLHTDKYTFLDEPGVMRKIGVKYGTKKPTRR